MSLFQILNEILQTKQAVYKLRKEHDELKYKLSQVKKFTNCFTLLFYIIL